MMLETSTATDNNDGESARIDPLAVDAFVSATDPLGEKCRCITPPLDDGIVTCWLHHDCTRGDCTHSE